MVVPEPALELVTIVKSEDTQAFNDASF